VPDPLTERIGRQRVWDFGLVVMGVTITAQLVLHGLAAYGIGWEPAWMPYDSTAYHLFWTVYYAVPTSVMVYLLVVAPPMRRDE